MAQAMSSIATVTRNLGPSTSELKIEATLIHEAPAMSAFYAASLNRNHSVRSAVALPGLEFRVARSIVHIKERIHISEQVLR